MVDTKDEHAVSDDGVREPDQNPEESRSPWAARDRRDRLPVMGFREYWYPALPLKMVGKHPRPWNMLGENLVFFQGKEKGTVACITPVCRHRGGNLAEGECHWRGTISCPYHGWTYDETGELVAVLPEGPNSMLIDKGIKARTYPTKVLRDMVFVWMGDGEPAPIEEDVPPEFFDPKAHVKYHIEYWETNWRQAVENAADAHAPYVHRNSFRSLMGPMNFAGPVNERVKIVNNRAAVMAGRPQGAPRPLPADGRPYFEKLGHHWPKSYWRRLMSWAFLWGRKRRARIARSGWEPNPSEEWAGVLQHLPAIIRRNNTGYIYTRNNIPIHPNCTRQIYYHWSDAKNWAGRLWENVQWNVFHAWMHYTNFSQQDLKAVRKQRWDTEEYLSPNDTPVVGWRRLCTMARDFQRAEASVNGSNGTGRARRARVTADERQPTKSGS